MQVMITADSTTDYPNLGRYRQVSAACGKHEVTVVLAPNHVTVLVNNATQRAWRGMGKDFPSLAAALANYKTPAIKAILSAIV